MGILTLWLTLSQYKQSMSIYSHVIERWIPIVLWMHQVEIELFSVCMNLAEDLVVVLRSLLPQIDTNRTHR